MPAGLAATATNSLVVVLPPSEATLLCSYSTSAQLPMTGQLGSAWHWMSNTCDREGSGAGPRVPGHSGRSEGSGAAVKMMEVWRAPAKRA